MGIVDDARNAIEQRKIQQAQIEEAQRNRPAPAYVYAVDQEAAEAVLEVLAVFLMNAEPALDRAPAM
jgi:hypothetical protein